MSCGQFDHSHRCSQLMWPSFSFEKGGLFPIHARTNFGDWFGRIGINHRRAWKIRCTTAVWPKGPRLVCLSATKVWLSAPALRIAYNKLALGWARPALGRCPRATGQPSKKGSPNNINQRCGALPTAM